MQYKIEEFQHELSKLNSQIRNVNDDFAALLASETPAASPELSSPEAAS